MERLFDVATARFGLVVHIGCGEAAGSFWQGRVDDLVLVEPDPERALAVQNWVEGHGSAELVEAAVAERSGDGSFRRMSFGDLNSLRAPTGATALFPGLRSLESVPVKLVQPRDLLAGRDPGTISGRTALVVDAPSEVLVVLADLEDAGMLDHFDTVVVSVAEAELHEGGADRAGVDAWLTASRRRIVWEEDPADPDVRYALVEKDWKACSLQNSKRVQELESTISDLRSSYSRMSEQNRASLDGLNEELDALTAARDQARAEVQATLDTLDEISRERDALKDEVSAGKEASAQAIEQLSEMKAELEATQHRYADQGQSTQRLSAELDALRDDNRLSLRIQRIAQADLADLQDRYAVLADEKRQLEHFLDDLAQKVIEAQEKEPLPAPKRAPARAKTGATPAAKRSGARSRAKPS